MRYLNGIRKQLLRKNSHSTWVSRIIIGLYILGWVAAVLTARQLPVNTELVALLKQWIAVLTPPFLWVLKRTLKEPTPQSLV